MVNGEKSCFVIAPIGSEGSETRKRSDLVLKHIIKPAAEECGYKAVRADEISEPGVITTQVIQRLIDDDLVIADLTERNPNVFYELAIRHAIRKPVVQIIKRDERIPFDVTVQRTIQYDLDLESAAACKEELIKQIRAAEKDPEKVDSPVSTAIDLRVLRESENPVEKSIVEIVPMLEEIRTMVQDISIQPRDSKMFESMLKGLMPVPIFEEIDTQIIRKPFLRKNFRWLFEFTWKDESRKSLRRSGVIQYEVENISRIPAMYEIITIEERTRENQNEEIVYIKEVQVERDDMERPRTYSKADLMNFIREIGQYIEMRIPLELQPNQSARIKLGVENIFPDRDVYYCCAAISTIHMELSVSHPDDLCVQAMPMHPSGYKFKKEIDTPTLKRWRIETALLPFQGIELSWRPTSR